MDLFEKYQLDKTKVFFGTREEVEEAIDEAEVEGDEDSFEDRLEKLELLRQIHYANYSPTDPIQRVFDFVEGKRG